MLPWAQWGQQLLEQLQTRRALLATRCVALLARVLVWQQRLLGMLQTCRASAAMRCIEVWLVPRQRHLLRRPQLSRVPLLAAALP